MRRPTRFGGDSFLPLLPRYRTCLSGGRSRSDGLAGMRVGIVIGPSGAAAVRDVTLPFNINVIALTAVKAALDDTEFLPRYAAQVRESRERLYAACPETGLQYWESPPIMCSARGRDGASHPGALGAEDSRSGSIEGSGHARDASDHRRQVEHTTAGLEALESVGQ